MSAIDFEQLAAPFEPADLDWRVGNKSKKGDKATLLVYLTSRAVQARLDEVAGPDRWRNSFVTVYEGVKVVGYLCTIELEVEPGKWVAKCDGSDPTDIESFKGGLSGAMKRAAVLWGIGRYLYDVDSSWHTIREGWGPDGAIHCPMGPDKQGPPGHIPVPTLPAKHLPKPKGKAKPKPTVPDPTPEHQQAADEVAAARAAKAKADEERRKTHDSSWPADHKQFFVDLAQLGLNKDIAMELGPKSEAGCPTTEFPQGRRPSQMTRKERFEFLVWLGSDAGRLAYDAAVVAREMGGAA